VKASPSTTTPPAAASSGALSWITEALLGVSPRNAEYQIA
jgi:hypothetical protein